MNGSDFFARLSDFYRAWEAPVQAFLVILFILVVNAVVKRIWDRLSRREAGRHTWDDALIEAGGPPLRALIWLLGLSVAVHIVSRDLPDSFLAQTFPPARNVAAIAISAWFLTRLVRAVEQNIHAQAKARGEELDPTAADVIGKLIRAAIVITALLEAIQALGFSISGLLAFGGIGGIAIGFAAQGLVSNLFGGLTVYADKPFKVGDVIFMPQDDVSGTVLSIGWRSTRLMGFDRRPFYVPNSMFNTAVVINQSRMTHRRIQEHLHVRYQDLDRIPGIVAEANAMLADYPGIQHDFFVFRFDGFGEFALKLYLYVFTETTAYAEYVQIKEDLLLRLAAIAKTHGAQLALPAREVHFGPGQKPPAAELQGLAEPES